MPKIDSLDQPGVWFFEGFFIEHLPLVLRLPVVTGHGKVISSIRSSPFQGILKSLCQTVNAGSSLPRQRCALSHGSKVKGVAAGASSKGEKKATVSTDPAGCWGHLVTFLWLLQQCLVFAFFNIRYTSPSMCHRYTPQFSCSIRRSDIKILAIKMYYDLDIFFKLSNISWNSQSWTAARCWWNKNATHYVLCETES